MPDVLDFTDDAFYFSVLSEFLGVNFLVKEGAQGVSGPLQR